MSLVRILAAGIVAAIFGSAAVSAADAQSVTLGSVSGSVRDARGTLLSDAGVTIRDTIAGFGYSLDASPDGTFVFPLLRPGGYQLFVELAGYRPTLVRGLRVLPGREVDVSVELVSAAPPVTRIDTVELGKRQSLGSRAGVRRWFSTYQIARAPGERRGMTDLGRFVTASNRLLDTEGLPGWMSGTVVDGVAFQSARHVGLAEVRQRAAAFPLSSLSQAELITGGLDVEWSGVPGAYLSGHSRRGTQELHVQVFGDWSGDDLTDSDAFVPSAVSATSVRGGFTLSAPVIRDTASLIVGMEARRLETPLPPAWAEPDPELLAVATDSFGVELAPYTSVRRERTDVVSAFARFDWQLSSANAVSIRANVASMTGDEPQLGRAHIASVGSSLDGLEGQVALSLSSVLTPSIWHELRVAWDASDRKYVAPELPATRVVAGGVAFGSDPALPGEFDQSVFRAIQNLHFGLRRHHLKLGVAMDVSDFDHLYDFGRVGEYAFASTTEFAGGQGAFGQAVGSLPATSFSTSQFAAYLQDRWAAALGVELLWGMRLEVEKRPVDEVRLNQAWLERTGLQNNDFNRTDVKWSPRVGFVWDLRNRHQWLLQGELGTFYGTVDPGVLTEVIARDGRAEMRRGVGTLPAWPAAPDNTSAPTLGPSLSLLGPDFEAPRTVRGGLGVTRRFDDGWALHLAGNVRHTDFLPRRHNLNRVSSPPLRDQFGRALYGVLVQQGNLVTSAPGSNRRFSDFGLVSALNPDGFSDYWGATVTVEKTLDDVLGFMASYTHSRTTDNWLSGIDGSPDLQLTPFPDSLAGLDWADGRSDFDVPHRFTLGVELTAPGLSGLAIAGFYRLESGPPFTPGFRDGVDANGDGSARNDPAFVDDGMVGIPELITEWPCLRNYVGRFVERNACREPARHWLDVRVAFALPATGAQIVVEALNVLEADVAVRDRALYLIDPAGTLTTDPSAGVVTVPLRANANFGKPLWHRTTGRMLRLGLRMRY